MATHFRADRPVRMRFAIPAVAVPVAIAAAILVPMQAGAAVDLPDKTPEELIAFVLTSDTDALSGTIEQTSELGLPDLGALTGAMGGSADPGGSRFGDPGDPGDPAELDDLIALATGSHTANVYLDGSKLRMQVLDQLAERSLYVDGEAGEAWFVDSETLTATRLTVSGERETAAVRDAVATPDAVLRDALTKLDETTEVTVGADARVAGRDVYELVLTPRTDQTLVGEVRFAIDGEFGVPLAASITARGAADPAFSVSFTNVRFGAPDPSVFVFAPGEGVTVSEKELELPAHGDKPDREKSGGPEAIVHGEGWERVVELPAPPRDATSGPTPDAGGDPAASEVLETLTSAVDGGRVLSTSLVTVLFTDDGRVLAGAVPAERLVEVASSGR